MMNILVRYAYIIAAFVATLIFASSVKAQKDGIDRTMIAYAKKARQSRKR